MFYDGYHFWGMHLFWWFVWGFLLIWIFVTPYEIPGQRSKSNSALDILKRRLARGQITTEQYNEIKSELGSDLQNKN